MGVGISDLLFDDGTHCYTAGICGKDELSTWNHESLVLAADRASFVVHAPRGGP